MTDYFIKLIDFFFECVMTVVHTFIVLQASAVWTDSDAVASHLVDVIPPFFILHTHFSPAR